MKQEQLTISMPNKPYACVSPRIGHGDRAYMPDIDCTYVWPDNPDEYDYIVVNEKSFFEESLLSNEITFDMPQFGHFTIKAHVKFSLKSYGKHEIWLRIFFGNSLVYENDRLVGKGDVSTFDITKILVLWAGREMTVLGLVNHLHTDIAYGRIKLNHDHPEM